MNPNSHRGFTLAEVLVALAILAVLLVGLATLISATSRAWVSGEQQVSEFQDGRAIVELMSRELSQAVMSQSLQFVQNPTLPPGLNQRVNSDSIFWLGPSKTTASGNLSEIGYYLVEDHGNSGSEAYQLKRFYVPPTDTNNYQIFSLLNQPTDTSAPWVSSFVTSALSTPIASGVIALWIRCFDANNDPIPWLSSNVTGVGPLKFNSAAHFQSAVAGPTPSFQYTTSTSTARANLLPATVEFTIVILDPQSFKRNPQIPAQTAQVSPSDLPSVRDTFNQQLLSNNVRNAHTFTTRARLLNWGL